MCVDYKLVTYWQNFTEIFLTWVKFCKEFQGATFLTHTVDQAVGASKKGERWQTAAVFSPIALHTAEFALEYSY